MSRIAVENINTPGKTVMLDGAKVEAARAALLRVLPGEAPGLTQAEMIEAMHSALPDDLFPGGAKAGWWTKCVQLDLEAKGQVVRAKGPPTRWRRA